MFNSSVNRSEKIHFIGVHFSLLLSISVGFIGFRNVNVKMENDSQPFNPTEMFTR